ncbi:MAG: PIN/TRAM domain-containing protein [Planctomycetaceae bacterium]|nr:PIN/TRAM domain-containing protein [Planctomycetaceae bacterium]
MLLIIIRAVYAFVCAGAIATYVSPGARDYGIDQPQIVRDYPFLSFTVLLALTQSVTLIDLLLRRKRIEVISAVYFGLLVGALLSYLLLQALAPAIRGTDAQGAVELLVTLILPYVSISLLLQTKDDFRFVIPYVEFARELKGGKPLILDSSALIDGRIADVIETRIIDAQIIVPQFILHEVQEIADSGDKSRRSRGRRGLEVLAKLQNSPVADVRVQEAKEDVHGKEVDHRLIDLAKQVGGRIVTNDFNLNKVAGVQGVDCINLNDVANALKPRYLPGDHVHIKVIKEGESPGQGVGYLDDGTMVICEQAARQKGKEIDVVVTSVLQSSAGRMIFGREAVAGDRYPDRAAPPMAAEKV